MRAGPLRYGDCPASRDDRDGWGTRRRSRAPRRRRRSRTARPDARGLPRPVRAPEFVRDAADRPARPVRLPTVPIREDFRWRYGLVALAERAAFLRRDRKSTRLNSSHLVISYA